MLCVNYRAGYTACGIIIKLGWEINRMAGSRCNASSVNDICGGINEPEMVVGVGPCWVFV